MTTIVDYALMAGASYRSTRDDINKFPIPSGWIEQLPFQVSTPANGFEARTFQSGTQVVISYAGTATAIDWDANFSLAAGFLQSQLTQAAAYYLQVKAANPGATITLTGHSLDQGSSLAFCHEC